MDRPFLLIPLYIYPSEGAWEPLFQAARAYGEVQFVAIINPDNGPGRGALPDGSYKAVLRRLAAVPNVRALGYVHCSYGQRPAAAIEADMDVYRGWKGQVALGGVFFDETPSDRALAGYMAGLGAYAKTTWTRDLGTDAMVVYNPGVMVAPDLFVAADAVVVFEESEEQWRRRGVAGAELHDMDESTRSKMTVIVHSGPAHERQVGDLLGQLRRLGLTGVFITDQQNGCYTRWPAAWMRQVAAVARCG